MTTAMAIGPTLGPYEIISRLSVGGMGEVYLAEDTKLHRKVALKVLPQEWGADPTRLERFQWEAQVLAKLNHPNIVTIYSVENHDDVHYFTMELVEGQTLREAIPPHGLSLDRFLELAVPLADALQVAHERGIIHRDVKPGNVMVRPDGRVKMLDFGLAKRDPSVDGQPVAEEEARALKDEPQTQEGRLLGTVAYMSPEQIAGRPLDHRADIFALGVVFYEMLTGVRPFETPSWDELVKKRLTEKPPVAAPPDAELPERLEEIVLRCLEKLPEDRYQTAVELREELEALRLEFVSGSFSSTQILPPRLGNRRRTWAVAAVLGAALVGAVAVLGPRLVTGGGRAAAPAARAPDAAATHQKRIVVLPFQNLGPPEDQYFAAGITEEITSRLATVRGLMVISRTTALQVDRGARTTREIGADLGVDHMLEGTVRWSRDGDGRNRVRVTAKLIRVADDSHVWSESYDRVIDDVFAVQSEVATEVIQHLGIALPESWGERSENPEAYQAYLRGMDYATRHNPTRENWELAADMFERAVRHDPRFTAAWAELSRVHSFIYKQDIDKSPARLEKAYAAAQRALDLDPGLPDGHRALGYYYYWGHGDYERALEEFGIAAESLPNDSPLFEEIAYIRRRQGRFDEALTSFEEALKLDPANAWLTAELARTLTNLRRYAEAERRYDQAINLSPDEPLPYQMKAMNTLLWTGDIDRARQVLGEIPRPDETGALYFRFRVEAAARNYTVALDLLRRIETSLVGLDSVLFPKELTRGTIYTFMDRKEEATADFEQSRRVLEARVRERPGEPRLRSALGLTYAALGMKEEAIREGEKAALLMPVEHDAFIGPEYLEHLAVIHAWVGNPDEAVDLVERVLSMPAALSRTYLGINPRWDPLRGNPRFEALLAGRDPSGP